MPAGKLSLTGSAPKEGVGEVGDGWACGLVGMVLGEYRHFPNTAVLVETL